MLFRDCREILYVLRAELDSTFQIPLRAQKVKVARIASIQRNMGSRLVPPFLLSSDEWTNVRNFLRSAKDFCFVDRCFPAITIFTRLRDSWGEKNWVTSAHNASRCAGESRGWNVTKRLEHYARVKV